MSRLVPHISSIRASDITFGPVENKDGKVKVEVYRDATSTQRSNRLNRFNLCTDAMKPLPCRFNLDTVREDGNPNRRGLMLKVTDEDTARTLREIDEVIFAKAIECSK